MAGERTAGPAATIPCTWTSPAGCRSTREELEALVRDKGEQQAGRAEGRLRGLRSGVVGGRLHPSDSRAGGRGVGVSWTKAAQGLLGPEVSCARTCGSHPQG